MTDQPAEQRPARGRCLDHEQQRSPADFGRETPPPVPRAAGHETSLAYGSLRFEAGGTKAQQPHDQCRPHPKGGQFSTGAKGSIFGRP
jgi:hypothetical protein